MPPLRFEQEAVRGHGALGLNRAPCRGRVKRLRVSFASRGLTVTGLAPAIDAGW